MSSDGVLESLIDYVNLPIDQKLADAKKSDITARIKHMYWSVEKDIKKIVENKRIPQEYIDEGFNTYKKVKDNYLEVIKDNDVLMIYPEVYDSFKKYINNKYSDTIKKLDEDLGNSYINTGIRAGKWSILHNKDTSCEEQCPICLEEFTADDIRSGNIIKHSGVCKKCMHKKCLSGWYLNNQDNLKCPMCRNNFGKVKYPKGPKKSKRSKKGKSKRSKKMSKKRSKRSKKYNQ
jgi:hypothetical protein